MSYENKYPDWEKKIKIASETTLSASQAAASLGIKYDTYKRYAIKYGCFNTNQAGKNIKRNCPNKEFPLKDILNGKYPQYQSNKLRIRLLKERVFKHICNNCKNTEWLNNPIPLEL